jgi:type III secretory pathway lipoprotein EscJ
MTASSFLNGSADTNRNKEQLVIVVVDAITGVLYSEIYVVTEPNQDRVIKSTTDAVDGTYKLKLTDANGNGLSTLSNDFDVIFN